MNKSNDPRPLQESSLRQTVVAFFRVYLGGRRGLIVLSVLSLGAAAIFNWGWLVAIGVAPLLVAFAPCAAGLCMHKMSKYAGPSQPDAGAEIDAETSLSSASAAVDATDKTQITAMEPEN